MTLRGWPKWILWALALRLVLMPTHFHSDLLFIHYFPSFLSGQGVWDIYGYFEAHYLSRGFTYYQPLVYYTIGFFQWCLQPMNPNFDVLMKHVHSLFYSGQSIPADFWASYSWVDRMRFIFFMKAPYLILDAIAIKLIYEMQEKRFLPQRTSSDWAFHPVILFAVYMFGQHRMIGAMLVWFMLYALFMDKKKTAFGVLGLLLLTDCYPLLLIAPALICIGRGWRERLVLFLCCAAPIAMVLGALAIHSGLYPLYSYFSPLVLEVSLKSVTLQHAAWIGPLSKIFLVLGYGVVLVKLMQDLRHHATPQDKTQAFIRAATVVLLLLYATTSTALHYFMWVMPFWVCVVSSPGWGQRLPWAIIGLLFVFNLDSPALNAGLWVPLDPRYFSALPSFHEWVAPVMDWGFVVGSSRVLFSLLCLAMILKIEINKRVGITHG